MLRSRREEERMKTRMALALCLVLLLPYLLVQAHIIKTDDRLLDAMKSIRRGMTVDEVFAAIETEARPVMHANNVADHPDEKYVIRFYMGVITSRNLPVFFDADKRGSFVSWENT